MGAEELLLELRERNITQRLENPLRVEPSDPFKRRIFHVVEALPGPTPMDHLGLVQANDRLGERIVGCIARAAGGGEAPASARRLV